MNALYILLANICIVLWQPNDYLKQSLTRSFFANQSKRLSYMCDIISATHIIYVKKMELAITHNIMEVTV